MKPNAIVNVPVKLINFHYHFTVLSLDYEGELYLLRIMEINRCC